jgi:hypothetical protein
MALDHVSVSVATTPTLLYTVPKGATQSYITVQNRDTSAAIIIGDSSLAGLGSADGGIKIPAVVGTAATSPANIIQFWANGGDAIYAMASTTPAVTFSCIVLSSYVQTGSAS